MGTTEAVFLYQETTFCAGQNEPSSPRIVQATCVHAGAEVHAVCRHTCKHSIKEASQEHRIHKRTCVHPHTHTCCGLRCDAEPTASEVPIQRSPRICLPAGVNLQPWSSDIQPRIATSRSKETDALCATSCAYTLPLGSAPLPPSPLPLALFFLFGYFIPALRRRSCASTSPRKGPYLSDRQMSPQLRTW